MAKGRQNKDKKAGLEGKVVVEQRTCRRILLRVVVRFVIPAEAGIQNIYHL